MRPREQQDRATGLRRVPAKDGRVPGCHRRLRAPCVRALAVHDALPRRVRTDARCKTAHRALHSQRVFLQTRPPVQRSRRSGAESRNETPGRCRHSFRAQADAHSRRDRNLPVPGTRRQSKTAHNHPSAIYHILHHRRNRRQLLRRPGSVHGLSEGVRSAAIPRWASAARPRCRQPRSTGHADCAGKNVRRLHCLPRLQPHHRRA